jgi:transcriptional regulator with XRE-family HTH domain
MAIRGDRVKEARVARGITQEQLAAAVDSSQSAVVRWENSVGEPRANTLRALSRVLRVSTDWLTGKTDDPEARQSTAAGPEHKITGAVANHPDWPTVRAQLAVIYSEEILDEVASAQFATGPREYLDTEYARRLADAIAYARAQALK